MDGSVDNLARALVPMSVDFEAVFREHFRPVATHLRMLGVREPEVDDAAQEVFLIVHRRLRTLDTSRSLTPWILGVAFRVARGFLRRAHARREVPEGDADRFPSEEVLSDEALADHESYVTLLKILECLDLERRAIFVMHDVEDVSAVEIAAALSVSVNTVYSRLRLARAEVNRAAKRYVMRQGDPPR